MPLLDSHLVLVVHEYAHSVVESGDFSFVTHMSLGFKHIGVQFLLFIVGFDFLFSKLASLLLKVFDNPIVLEEVCVEFFILAAVPMDVLIGLSQIPFEQIKSVVVVLIQVVLLPESRLGQVQLLLHTPIPLHYVSQLFT